MVATAKPDGETKIVSKDVKVFPLLFDLQKWISFEQRAGGMNTRNIVKDIVVLQIAYYLALDVI